VPEGHKMGAKRRMFLQRVQWTRIAL